MARRVEVRRDASLSCNCRHHHLGAAAKRVSDRDAVSTSRANCLADPSNRFRDDDALMECQGLGWSLFVGHSAQNESSLYSETEALFVRPKHCPTFHTIFRSVTRSCKILKCFRQQCVTSHFAHQSELHSFGLRSRALQFFITRLGYRMDSNHRSSLSEPSRAPHCTLPDTTRWSTDLRVMPMRPEQKLR